jgi:DNA repair exonuclease SbcCD nuclease subunit
MQRLGSVSKVAGTSQESFTFVHAADLHLDTPFHGIGEVAPRVADALREASLDAFDDIVACCIEREAAFLLVAGDIYDGAERGLRAQLRFRDGLGRLAAAGILSFVVHGNHDPIATGWSAIGSSWPKGVTIFGSDEVAVVPVIQGGIQIATVQGISYAKVETTENLALRFHRPEGPGFHIGLLHCNVAGVTSGYANYSPCSLEDLRKTGLDYLALGHIHQRRVLSGKDGSREPWIVYPGNSQARSPKPSEREPKGTFVVHVNDGAVQDLEFVACDRVRYDEVECSIVDLEDLGNLEDHLEELRVAALERADGRSLVLRVRLVGRGKLHRDLVRTGVLEELLVRMREHTGSEPFCWWDEIYDETAGELDLDALRKRGDFASDLLGLADALGDDEDARRALAEELSARVPRHFASRLEKLLGEVDQLEAIVSHATTLALDEITSDTP